MLCTKTGGQKWHSRTKIWESSKEEGAHFINFILPWGGTYKTMKLFIIWNETEFSHKYEIYFVPKTACVYHGACCAARPATNRLKTFGNTWNGSYTVWNSFMRWSCLCYAIFTGAETRPEALEQLARNKLCASFINYIRESDKHQIQQIFKLVFKVLLWFLKIEITAINSSEGECYGTDIPERQMNIIKNLHGYVN